MSIPKTEDFYGIHVQLFTKNSSFLRIIWYNDINKDYIGLGLLRVVWGSRYCEEFSLFSNVSTCASYRSMAIRSLGVLDDSFFIAFISTQFTMIDR